MTDFRLAHRSPDYAELMHFTPEASLAGYGLLLVIEALGAGLGAAFGFQRFAEDPMTQLLVVGGALAVGLVLLGLTTRSMLRYQAAPIERALALVRDESTETRVERSVHTAPNGTRRVSTRERTEYHLLLELEDGERQSHEVPEELARRVVIGDLGVAYYKAGDLLDFRPLRQPG
jgi:hypothetical protein